jgi:hypothetical protein
MRALQVFGEETRQSRIGEEKHNTERSRERERVRDRERHADNVWVSGDKSPSP